jgi:hypothetical protein
MTPARTGSARRALLVLCVVLGVSGSAVVAAPGLAARARSSDAPVFVNCQHFGRGGFSYRASIRPPTCTLQGLPVSGATEWNVSGLRWMGWGTTIAVANGVYHYRHGEYNSEGKLVFRVVPTRILLSRIRTGCDGRRFYTSVSDGETTERLADSCKAAV